MGLVSFKSGGGVVNTGYKPSSITNLSVIRLQKNASLNWTDPEDFTVDNIPCTWARTVLIRKVGSAPQSIHDGTEIAVITERNKYAETPYMDSISELDVIYYYAAYTVSTDGLISDLSNIVSITIHSSQTMSVIIDLNDSNPETCGSYNNDAIGMPVGKTQLAITAWQDFFGYKPCLFKDGKVVGYLNPNDYSKFENGDPADITSGDAGDVMVEFPRRGVKISKSGKIITVSMTDDPDDPEFTYYAHTRGETKKDYFYLGAYLGSGPDNYSNPLVKMRSLSDQNITHDKDASSLVYCAHENGEGYEHMTWYQLVYIQVMYVLQFKGQLNSQTTVGIGSGSESLYDHVTGQLNKNGLCYGDTSTGNSLVKLFGLEDLWNVYCTFIAGIHINNLRSIYITSYGNGTEEDKYTGSRIQEETGGYIDDVFATSELGFFPLSVNGSSSTFFCDHGAYFEDTICSLGSGSSTYLYENGIFSVDFTIGELVSDLVGRISYF